VAGSIVGDGRTVADRLEELFLGRACDGFVVGATHVPGAYADFVRFVVPELRRRGLLHRDYAGPTLRDNLGLPRPAIGAWRRDIDRSATEAQPRAKRKPETER
jgi:hypothetical protein